jgi:hypothetical protein
VFDNWVRFEFEYTNSKVSHHRVYDETLKKKKKKKKKQHHHHHLTLTFTSHSVGAEILVDADLSAALVLVALTAELAHRPAAAEQRPARHGGGGVV